MELSIYSCICRYISIYLLYSSRYIHTPTEIILCVYFLPDRVLLCQFLYPVRPRCHSNQSRHVGLSGTHRLSSYFIRAVCLCVCVRTLDTLNPPTVRLLQLLYRQVNCNEYYALWLFGRRTAVACYTEILVHKKVCR